jgi:hypothetical protein
MLVAELQDSGVANLAIILADYGPVLVELGACGELRPATVAFLLDGNTVEDETPSKNLDFSKAPERATLAGTPI